MREQGHRLRVIWQRSGIAYRAIIANASSLVGATAVTSALGFVYWWLAARQYPSATVGLASASISAMTLLGTVGMMGLGTLLIGELPRHRGTEGAILSTVSLITTGAGSALGVAFALIAPLLSPDFAPLRMGVGSVSLFGIGVGLTAMTLVLDQALIGMMRGGLQLGRNVIFAASKLVALAVFALLFAHTFRLVIFATWAIGNILSLMLLIGFALTRRASLGRFRPDWRVLRVLRGAALGHHSLNLSLQFSNLLLPLIVTVTLSASANAYFYTAWMIAGFVFTLPFALTVVLYAVGQDDPVALARKIRFTLGVAAATGAVANVVLWFVSPFVLRLFGDAYASQSSGALRILAVGVFALIIKDHYVAVNRIAGRVFAASTRILIGSCLELAGATVGALLGGLVGLTLGWLVAVMIEALFMSPVVFRVVAPSGLRRWRLSSSNTLEDTTALTASPSTTPVPLSNS